jgi:4,5:9,10-diseco-3-hydroxy-5,9,17-trioxoandrosta-1(10),2-diene-4-oate hydrolase
MGAGDPPLLLIHGLGGHIHNWQTNIPVLAQSTRVYAVDLVGFGYSDKPQVDYSIPYFVEFVKNFMGILGIERAVLVGESMGGAISLRIALKYPHLVEKLVLGASAGIGKEISPMLRMMSVPFLGEYITRPSLEGTARLFNELFHDKEIIQQDWIEDYYQIAALPGAQWSLLKATRSLCNFWGAKPETYRPILDRLETLTVPTLIIWGNEDRILPVAHAHKIAKRLPNATLKIFNDCGHVPNIECAEAFNAAVLEFLEGDSPAE